MNNFLLGQDLVMKKVPRIFYQILLALSPVDNIKGMIKYREKRKEPIVCLIKAKIGTTCVFSMAFNDKQDWILTSSCAFLHKMFNVSK